ncbi:very-long-chain enoyl-CoA reductase-like [Tripterygium wilfordii]|uniref:Very-long-chain enoyl-CoA reductase-like n=1 Tax=Tripterygium wilfordii TaxID=458696 RepID=A0A7J7C5K2_TRIWF|nr:3-oxo-5-alpha-steroid 4-dehydrogenase 2 [Tripterygium wilfordii]KAF5729382.1 very-long-chain enoyl-CoA reductase-like [Tripterygium wilfordii]
MDMGFVSVLQKIVYPCPSSFIKVWSVVNLVSMAHLAISEARGKHLQYSKFWNVGSGKSKTKQINLSARTGMLMIYTPAFLVSAASLGLFQQEGLRFLLLGSALALHFFKRIFEVMYVHKYSSSMVLESVLTISLGYAIPSGSMLYLQHLAQGFPEPQVDLKCYGIVLFLLGISGNFYHHYLLSMLRTERNDKEYMVPKGGLFDLVICPHYLFEILSFFGMSLIAQTLYAYCVAISTTFYLMGRSYATKRWYISKFEDFPKNVRALIPFVF